LPRRKTNANQPRWWRWRFAGRQHDLRRARSPRLQGRFKKQRGTSVAK
jgi:hypothetical protein